MEHFDFNAHDDAAGLLELTTGFATTTTTTTTSTGTISDHRPSSAGSSSSSSYPPFAAHPHSSHLAASPWRPLGPHAMDEDDNMYYQPPQHPPPYTAAAAADTSQRRQRQQQQESQQLQQHHYPPRNPQLPPSLSQEQDYGRPKSHANHQPPVSLHSSGLDLDFPGMFPSHWQVPLHEAAHQHQQTQPQSQPQLLQHGQHSSAFNLHHAGLMHLNTFQDTTFAGAQLHSSPVDFMPTTTADIFPVPSSMDGASFGPIHALSFPLGCANGLPFPRTALNADALAQPLLDQQAAEAPQSSVFGGSPSNTLYELSDTESYEYIHSNRNSGASFTVDNPGRSLHISPDASPASDEPHSAGVFDSWEDLSLGDYLDAAYPQQPVPRLPLPPSQEAFSSDSLAGSPAISIAPHYPSSGSSDSLSTSPTSSGPTSPPFRRRKPPLEGKTPKTISKKTASTSRKETAAEKKVGRRRGPLHPDQRRSAHEIRKLRACLRCKFLKKTCDKGEPCGGCRPSHARLWQVPCTRMDIKDIAYFMKDWKADFERHVSLGFSVGNIKGFSTLERTLYITHGHGHYLPISAREVFVRDDKCFGLDWVESIHDSPLAFEIKTAKLSAGLEGVSSPLLSEYLDRHLEQGFEGFVDEHFEGTPFLTEILKTAYRYYQREKNQAVRKALKLVIAYNLTFQVTMVEGLSEEEHFTGKIEDESSRYFGKTVAPVMINFQVKCALADMWRELQRDILTELSTLYSSVYSGDKLKNWPTIFMLAAILLAIWEEMQFDCHFRVPDEAIVNKFCDDMESTPVGVIVGLFQAISTKLPGLQEWDTKKHHHLLNSNAAVCDALTEVRGHVNKYETYLKDRQNAKFDRNDFDCLSNKFLSKLVIRAN